MMKTVLVSGATRGLGRAIALELVGAGYRVIGTGRGPEAPSDWPARNGLTYASLDLEQIETVHEFALRVQKEHGPLYGLVNNAAIGGDGLLATMSEALLAQVVTVNLMGSLMLTKYAVRSMLLGGEGGRVVSLASIVATTGFKGLSVYAGCKGGLVSFSKSLAREVGAAGITVNCVSPGFLETEMTSGLSETDLERIRRRTSTGALVDTSDVAGAVNYLMSTAGKSVTGIDWVVDGGHG